MHIHYRLSPRVLLLLGVLFGALFLGGCYPQHLQSTFDAAGPVAQKQLTLFYYIFWAMAFVFVTVLGGMLYIVLRFRRRAGEDRVPRQVHGHRVLEIAWTIPPFLVLTVAAVPAIFTLFELDRPPAGALEVKVIGHQWWWEFQYPEQGIVTANELHIPVGRAVNFTLTSADVIHSFWVPKLGGKQDAIPTRETPLWLQADKTGEYYGQCAEFCGTSHANMRLRVIAEAPEEFDRWVGRMQAPAKPAAELAGLAAEGAKAFAQGACIACHTVKGVAEFGKVGPDLTHVASRGTIASGLLINNSADMTRWLQDPPGVKPGSKMPNLQLSEVDITRLVAYLQSLE